jgi:hypothetical protein
VYRAGRVALMREKYTAVVYRTGIARLKGKYTAVVYRGVIVELTLILLTWRKS